MDGGYILVDGPASPRRLAAWRSGFSGSRSARQAIAVAPYLRRTNSHEQSLAAVARGGGASVVALLPQPQSHRGSIGARRRLNHSTAFRATKTGRSIRVACCNQGAFSFQGKPRRLTV